MTAAVVVPTIREECIKKFIEKWESQLGVGKAELIVVEDHPRKEFHLGEDRHRPWLTHFSHEDIDKDLGQLSWIIPRKTSAVRSYGFWKAWQAGYETIITLDDDCYPSEDGFMEKHQQLLDLPCCTRWQNTAPGLLARGFPYGIRQQGLPTAINHGLWDNVPDLDGPTQLLAPVVGYTAPRGNSVIPHGTYFPMCIMNVAFKAVATPIMYMLLMGSEYKYSRFDDIWAGVIAKKICDHLGYGIRSGSPVIWHDRASNVFKNLQAEAAGLEMNETFWCYVDRIQLTATTFKECYVEVAEKLDLHGEYWERLKEAMKIWARLF